jgi:hypothetical protein
MSSARRASADKRLVSLAEHPRAGASIRRAKAWGGLAGFGLMTAVGLLHGSPLDGTLGRALVGGIVAYLIAWAVAVAVVKRVLIAEATAAARRRAESASAAE